MENLDNIKVTVIEKNAVTVTASQQMISFPTLVGPAGPQGPQGPAGPSGQGAWGTISGDISEQTDLQDALDLKANTADLGDMATVDDAPSNGLEYVRKNGDWAVSSGGGGGGDATWGSITGTLSNQTDLQSALNAKQNTLTFDTTPTAASTNPVTSGGIKTALDAKANSADLGDLAEKDQAAWSTDISGIPAAFPPETHNHDDRYYTESETDILLSGKSDTGHNHDDRYYTETEVDTALAGKQNTLQWDITPTSGSSKSVNSGNIKNYVDNRILYFSSGGNSAMTVNAATNAQIGRIPASGIMDKITTDTVVLSIVFANPSAITSNVSWHSYDGYITFSGTCTSATTANVILGQKGN